jgi:hypothetical protein
MPKGISRNQQKEIMALLSAAERATHEAMMHYKPYLPRLDHAQALQDIDLALAQLQAARREVTTLVPPTRRLPLPSIMGELVERGDKVYIIDDHGEVELNHYPVDLSQLLTETERRAAWDMFKLDFFTH